MPHERREVEAADAHGLPLSRQSEERHLGRAQGGEKIELLNVDRRGRLYRGCLTSGVNGYDTPCVNKV